MKGDIVPVKERYTEYGKDWVKRYSDNGMMIERDGVQYSEAIDPSELGITYTETDIPVEAEATTETEQKAAAFDYLTGRSATNE